MIDLTAKWYDLVSEINTKLINGRATTRSNLIEFYEKAYECDPGCTCDNINLEYDQLIAWQKELVGDIKGYTAELKTYTDTEGTILNECPEYADTQGAYGDDI